MASMKDIFATLLEYFQTQLTDLAAYAPGGGTKTVSVDVKLAFRDERWENEENRQFPAAALLLYDAAVASDRRFGGYLEKVAVDQQAGTATITPNPVPVNLFFQLDTACSERGEDWAVQQQLLALFAARVQVTMPDTKVVPVVFQGADARDDYPDPSLIVKSYRFYLPVWFAHPDGARTEPIIQTLLITQNSNLISVEAA